MRSCSLVGLVIAVITALQVVSSASADNQTQVWNLATDFSVAQNSVDQRWSFYEPCTSGGSGGSRSRSWCVLPEYGTVNYWNTTLSAWKKSHQPCRDTFVGKLNGKVVANPGLACGGYIEYVSIVFLAPADGRLYMSLQVTDEDPEPDGCTGYASETAYTLKHLDTNTAGPGLIQTLASGVVGPGLSFSSAVDVEVLEGQRIELLFTPSSCVGRELVGIDWLVSYEPLMVGVEERSWGAMKVLFQ